MTTVFVTISESFTARNIFQTPFWSAFRKNNPNLRVVLLVPPEKKEHYEKSFGGDGVITESLDPRFRSGASRVVTSLMRSAINSDTNLWSKMRSYERGDSGFFVTFFKRAHTALLGGSSFYKNLLRSFLLRVEPEKRLAELFDTYKPGLLFASSLTQFDFDVPAALEARRRGIRIIGMVRSWDNLSSHGLLRVVPDRFIFQNAFLKKMAIGYQAIDPLKVLMDVVGLPHYDRYQNPASLLESRQSFFERLGLDPAKKLILYGAMGDFLFPHEGEIADILENLIESGKIKEDVQVIFRAHPKFTSPFERMKGMKHVRPDRKATYLTGELKSVEFEEEDSKHLINSLYHSDLVVAGASTIALDSCLFGKPVICVGFDPTHNLHCVKRECSSVQVMCGVDGKALKVPYWLSVKRFYDTYTHFEAFMATGAARLAGDPDELARFANEYLANPSLDSEKRGKAIELLAAPFDGKAAERLEKIISAEAKKLT